MLTDILVETGGGAEVQSLILTIHMNRGAAFVLKGRPGEAVRELDKALALSAQLTRQLGEIESQRYAVSIHVNRGAAHLKFGKWYSINGPWSWQFWDRQHDKWASRPTGQVNLSLAQQWVIQQSEVPH